jgi:hypothetical protein
VDAIRLRKRLLRHGTYNEITKSRPQNVRIICLPPEPKTASAEDWSRASQLSAVLAERELIDDYAGLPQSGAGEPQRGSQWTAVVVPRSIDREKIDDESDRELSKRLKRYLSALVEADTDQAIGGFGENST